jgi:hypothetical protein
MQVGLMQLYFLATAANMLAGLVLANAYLARGVPAVSKVGDVFAARGARLTLGAITAAAGLLTLLFPLQHLAVFGDFLPALAGMAGGSGLLASAITESRAATAGASKTTKGSAAPVVRAHGPVERAAKLAATYQMPLGIATLAAGLVHFLIPGTLFF